MKLFVQVSDTVSSEAYWTICLWTNLQSQTGQNSQFKKSHFELLIKPDILSHIFSEYFRELTGA